MTHDVLPRAEEPATTVLAMRDVHLSFSNGRRRVDVLTGASFELPGPGTVALVGPSGGGKTTVLNCIAGLVRPAAGTVSVLGRRHTERSDDDLADLRATSIGFVFQAFHLLPQLTALDNVALPLILRGVRSRDARERARDRLAQVGLDRRHDHRPYQLSGGEQQRAAIARALVTDPSILLADEPTGSLDADLADEILDLLLLVSAGRSLLLVTHAPQVARRLEHHYRVGGGKIEPVRPPALAAATRRSGKQG